MEHILNFFINSAYADTASAAAQPGGGYSFLIMFLVFFAFIYFAIWRPQNKRAKELQNLLNSLNKGDEVLTNSGMLGRINKISEQYITLSIANNVEVIIQKSSVAAVLPKGTLKAVE